MVTAGTEDKTLFAWREKTRKTKEKLQGKSVKMFTWPHKFTEPGGWGDVSIPDWCHSDYCPIESLTKEW